MSYLPEFYSKRRSKTSIFKNQSYPKLVFPFIKLEAASNLPTSQKHFYLKKDHENSKTK